MYIRHFDIGIYLNLKLTCKNTYKQQTKQWQNKKLHSEKAKTHSSKAPQRAHIHVLQACQYIEGYLKSKYNFWADF